MYFKYLEKLMNHRSNDNRILFTVFDFVFGATIPIWVPVAAKCTGYRKHTKIYEIENSKINYAKLASRLKTVYLNFASILLSCMQHYEENSNLQSS